MRAAGRGRPRRSPGGCAGHGWVLPRRGGKGDPDPGGAGVPPPQVPAAIARGRRAPALRSAPPPPPRGCGRGHRTPAPGTVHRASGIEHRAGQGEVPGTGPEPWASRSGAKRRWRWAPQNPSPGSGRTRGAPAGTGSPGGGLRPSLPVARGRTSHRPREEEGCGPEQHLPAWAEPLMLTATKLSLLQHHEGSPMCPQTPGSCPAATSLPGASGALS